MPNTNPKEFQKFVAKIDKTMMDNIWLFPIRPNSKSPDVPTGNVIKNNLTFRLDSHAALKRFYSGLNVGVYALPRGLMFLDLDVENGKLKIPKKYLSGITKTLTIKSRNGGYHFYYRNDGKWKNQTIKIDGQIVGELRTNWQYVVSAGSYIDPSKDNYDGNGVYHIVYDTEIEQFNPGSLKEYIVEGTETQIRETPRRIKPDSGKIGQLAVFTEKLQAQNKRLVVRVKG